ncbi:hypothetical protein PG984_008353 [Apiospora sp. TS-2023a]
MTHSYFERLPPELLIPILTSLSGLESLDSILRASPAAYRVFDTYYEEIFEPLLSSGEIHQFTVSLIRISAYLRTSFLPPHVHDLHSLRNCLAEETTTYSHRKIVSLTVGCLDYYLSLFHALKPEHLVDKEFIYYHKQGEGGKHDYVGAWQLDPAREPFPMRDAGPPTWVEEQRVMRACWRLELFQSARVVIEAGRLPWPPDVEIYEPFVNEMGTDPLRFYDVAAGAPWWSHHSRVPPGHDEGDVNPYLTSEIERDLDAELIITVQTYLAEKNRQNIIASHDFLARARRRSWAAPAPEGPEDSDVLGNVWGVLLFFHDVSGGEYPEQSHWAPPHSPIKHVTFEPFRRVGFAIWSERRMRAGGFFGPPPFRIATTSTPAWRPGGAS